jgi:hypothetical protein
MNKYRLESLVFLFFGLFHIHRIWAFIDSKAYNNFWLGVLDNRGPSFFFLGVLLMILSIVVILYFLKNYKDKKWWRWIYLFGGIYVLFDSILNLLNNNFMINVVIKMYTIAQPYYYILWGLFILLGLVCIIICIYLWNYNKVGFNNLP